MSFFKNRYLWFFAIAAGLVYASQHYTIGGWEHLRVMSRSSDEVDDANSRVWVDPSAWVPAEATGAANSSFAASTPSGTASIRPSQTSRSASPPARWVSAPAMAGTVLSQKTVQPSLRVATFNLQSFGETKTSKVAVMEILAHILRSFDVIALQGIDTRQRDALPRLVDRINQSDRRFDYCIGPKVGPGISAMHFAFLFDSDRVEVDRYQLYTVDDPSDQLQYEPLVGWFRSRLAPDDQAFTFTLVNLRIDSPYAEREVTLLPELMRAILQDGRGEDDILLAGDFGCSDTAMQGLKKLGWTFAVEGCTTTIGGDEMLDNLLFSSRSTDEFLGRAGCMDFLRQFNLTPDQAFQVSSHMPVWCEFSAVEGGVPGYVP